MNKNVYKDSSDYVRRFQELHARTCNVSYDLAWGDLPTLLQQAVLWDLGLVVANVNGVDTLVQVYPLCSTSMDNLFFSPTTYLSMKDTEALTCSSSLGSYVRQNEASGPNITPAIRCAIDAANVPDAGSSMYAEDALKPTDVPDHRVWMHQAPGTSWVILGIHSIPKKYADTKLKDTPWGECPNEASGQASALTIPCVVYKTRPQTMAVCAPETFSESMHSWLVDFASAGNATTAPKTVVPTTTPTTASLNDESSNDTAIIIGAVAGVVGGLVLAVLLVLVFRRRKAAP
ncbi:hypothetical protein SDRG_05109 [Saprolegnia diclina VS20]|uniref:Uncharacterized protein n=1 Tax=Saprolegnia diclina (strain VS20) TaxID=1156394 RepID=T0QS50_SAPDV|nr:hypothetical protein SDRG_05109 [Saprolegnia diclina VS20]EQC37506.1 hypothetical protein SDRG_05109 [Saprolegnia diclina VS20]|eukprot:XP_008609026.1 hypothetical protein SDRG_05109 [Saprolegnia diclina VS20]